ncbi:MAG: TlyA family RNA methyltransferase [Bdellovibrionales bacterium]|nr:TlyA family RNA methyltransferase [Bdellovibrionales bacterium]
MAKGGAKKRIDVILVERGLVQSRERAQAMILAGNVLVEDVPCTKAGTSFPEDVVIRLREADHPYVSRGALKLKGALETFRIDVKDKLAADIGASTGGFTQVLLEAGVRKVVAIDVGTNQMDWKIRNDPRVECLEKVNARNLTSEIIRQKVDIAVIDVSFISLTKIFPSLFPFVEDAGDVISLIKPQFEAGREEVGKGGIVTSETARKESVERVTDVAKGLGWERVGLIESPITGTDGNIEYLALWKKRRTDSP